MVCEADLLAPALLNVRMSIRTFAELTALRPQINEALKRVPQEPLADLDEEADSIAQIHVPNGSAHAIS